MADKIVAPQKEHTLREKLVEIQNTEVLNDYRFAAKLGIVRQLWQSTRTGQRRIGLTLLKAVARTYPDLNDEILAFLRDGDGN